LPTRIQLEGVAYRFVSAQAPAEAGTLTVIGCAGPFEVASTDEADRADVLYLRSATATAAAEQVYRFEAALTFDVELEITERPQVLTALDQTYRLEAIWQPAVYSSTSVLLFVEDPEDESPAVIYALDVSHSPAGDAVGEYRLATDDAPAAEVAAPAGAEGLHPDLTINGERYTLVAVYTPAGTTRNGFMTLFGTVTEQGDAVRVLGRDQRELGLYVYAADAPAASPA
jgi:hypothetical protein